MTTTARPFAVPIDELATQLASNPATGLASAEAGRRLHEHGPNELPSERGRPAWRILWAQAKNVLIFILFVAIGLSLALGHGVEAAIIGVIACFAILLGFFQEHRAERALEALRKLTSPDATVVRDGQTKEVPSRDVVLGDVLVISEGDIVPADARLVESVDVRTDEAALTGESLPIGKHAKPLSDGNLPIGDRKNMIFAATAVTHGRGRALVVATGRHTEAGRIGILLREIDPAPTPLEANLRRVGQVLAWAAAGVVMVVAGLGLLQGRPVLDMVFFGIALAVAVVPEALPAIVTISLALGARRMAKRHALIRRLPTVEALGSVTVICSDKTGTLTAGEMTVREVHTAGTTFGLEGTGYSPHGGFRKGDQAVKPEAALLEALQAAALCTDADLVEDQGRWTVRGDPTEGALLAAAAKAGLKKSELAGRLQRVGEIPFTSDRKRMTTLHQADGRRVAFSKGAPEAVVPACSSIRERDGTARLDEAARSRILAAAHDMGSRAMRVLAIASREEAEIESAERDMTFLGLIGMLDPPRPEVQGALRTCFSAGIRPVMITGDHPGTARAIAAELGLLRRKEAVLTGTQLDRLTDSELRARVGEIDVFARVSPSHKLRIVEALQASGEAPAMTGDGVNDAPALKKAAVGVAMGVAGTEVAKGAAAVILTDDNFATIVAAVKEGRAIFDNIRKYLMYLLSSNAGEILLMASAVLLGLPLPLTAVQILYVNLATDGLPALALSVDPPAPDLMRRRPNRAGSGFFTWPIVALILTGGLWSAAVNISLFAWALGSGRSLQEAVTMAFVSLVLIQFFKAYAFRSDRHSVLRRPFANAWLNAAVLWEIGLLMLIVYVSPLSRAFGAFPLSLADWALAVGGAATILPVLEAGKALLRRTR